MSKRALPGVCLVLLTGMITPLAAPVKAGLTESKQEKQDDQLGTVDFSVRGNAEAGKHVVRGVKLLHHMMYAEARREFEAAAAADEACSLAWWGQAMAIITPLWTPPLPDDLRHGADLLERAKKLPGATPRETGYLHAMAAYFNNAAARPERERLKSAATAWNQVVEENPDDLDARAFCALFELADIKWLKKEESLRLQIQSGRVFEQILAKTPNHPGAHHYRIHAYDSPLLAERALEFCSVYGTIAPEVAHALHMPTHIFTRRGLWLESISYNLRSAEAGRLSGKQEGSGVTSHHFAHALDYLAYAYLQSGQYQKAFDVWQKVRDVSGPFNPAYLEPSAYALAAIPARCALERHDWIAATALEPRAPAVFPWSEKQAHCYSIVLFARTLGALRSGQTELAARHFRELEAAAAGIGASGAAPYWKSQAEVQVLTCRAWQKLSAGQREEAVALMREAATLEAQTDKHPVTPGEVLPAMELLGDMHLELGHIAEALGAYEATLELSPNRLNSLAGAAKTAEALNDRVKAKRYHLQLLAVTSAADTGIAAVDAARKFLSTVTNDSEREAPPSPN